jgi:hypothetical protein
MIDTIRAEAAYHARTGGLPTDNPYEYGTEYRNAWERVLIDGLRSVHTELKVTRKAYAKAIDDRLAVEAQLAQVQAEYDAFLLEQGY